MANWTPLDHKGQGPLSIRTKIDVALATRMLECNTHNRTVDDKHVARLSDDMVNGRWIITHQGIAYSADGVLLDGQHRLWAIVNGGVAVEMMVSYNVDPKSLGVIDIGKVRAVGQTFDLLKGDVGDGKQGRRLVARATVIRNIEGRGRKTTKFLYADADAVFKKHKTGLLWSLSLGKGARWIEVAPVSGALAFAYPTDPNRIEQFALQVKTGEMIKKGDPAYTLRAFIDSQPNVASATGWIVTLATLRAAMAFCKGESLAVIRPSLLLGAEDVMLSTADESINYFTKVHNGVVVRRWGGK